MSQLINIPGLKAPIGVGIFATYGSSTKSRAAADFMDDADPYDALLKLPPGDLIADLKVVAILGFPPSNGEGGFVPGNVYFQTVSAVFPKITQRDGVPTFSVTEKMLQGEPSNSNAQARSPFRFIDGKAWLTATQNPMFPAIKISMVLGSADVVVDTWESSKTNVDPTWKFELGAGEKKAAAGVIDKIIDWIPKPSLGYERGGSTSTTTKGGSRTRGQLYQTKEWTLLLELGERRKVRTPTVYKEGRILFIYFDTNAKEIGKYLHPQKKADQVKGLMRDIEELIDKYGAEHITGIHIRGYASRLGDTNPNLELSKARARHVAEKIKDIYHLKIDDEKVTHRGEPITEGNDKDNSWKDRAVIVTVDAERIVP
jgi:outer membrane protein OmpA-like peptidoglycan-associated protein